MVSSFVDICFDHLDPCLLFFPCLPCLAVVCHSSPAMLCLFKRNGTSATPALPWCANASLYPQLGDYHHSGGICLNRGVWMEGARAGGEIYVGITTLSLTQWRQTQALPQPIVPFFKFQYHSLLLKQHPPTTHTHTNGWDKIPLSGNLKWEAPLILDLVWPSQWLLLKWMISNVQM